MLDNLWKQKNKLSVFWDEYGQIFIYLLYVNWRYLIDNSYKQILI